MSAVRCPMSNVVAKGIASWFHFSVGDFHTFPAVFPTPPSFEGPQTRWNIYVFAYFTDTFALDNNNREEQAKQSLGRRSMTRISVEGMTRTRTTRTLRTRRGWRRWRGRWWYCSPGAGDNHCKTGEAAEQPGCTENNY